MSKREKLARSNCISGISRRKHTLISYIKIISRVAKFIVYCYSSSEGLRRYIYRDGKKEQIAKRKMWMCNSTRMDAFDIQST